MAVVCIVFMNKGDKTDKAVADHNVESSTTEIATEDSKPSILETAQIVENANGLTEEDMAKLDAIAAQAEQDTSFTNLKEVLEQYYSFAQEYDALDEVSEKAIPTYETYQNAILDHVALLEQQDTLPAMYIQMKLELDEVIQLAAKYNEMGISVDGTLAESKLSTLSEDYKSRLVTNFDNSAYTQINTNGVISRSVLWPLMENANETGLYNNDEMDDSLRLRYVIALTYHIDSELDNLDNAQAINRIYEVLEETDYSPLLLYYLAERYNDTNAYEWYYSVNNILNAYVGDFASLDLGGKRNFIFYYNTENNTYAVAREEIREYMEQNFN